MTGQKFIKNGKKKFGEFLKTWRLRSNSVTRQVIFKKTKIDENAKIKNQMRHFEWTKVNRKAKNSQFGDFWKTVACDQIVLPDLSL